MHCCGIDPTRPGWIWPARFHSRPCAASSPRVGPRIAISPTGSLSGLRGRWELPIDFALRPSSRPSATSGRHWCGGWARNDRCDQMGIHTTRGCFCLHWSAEPVNSTVASARSDPERPSYFRRWWSRARKSSGSRSGLAPRYSCSPACALMRELIRCSCSRH